MKLSDVVGNSGLSLYAEIAMILFVLAFVIVAVRLLLTKRESYDRAARLPLEDSPEGSSTAPASKRATNVADPANGAGPDKGAGNAPNGKGG